MKTFFTPDVTKLIGLAFLLNFFLTGNVSAQCPAPGISFPATPNQTLTAANGAQGIIAADFNGDGKLDLATANNGGSSISVYLNNGSGTYSAGNTMTNGTGVYAIAAADFTGDGKADIITANTSLNSVYLYKSTTVGVATATFSAATTVATGLSSPNGVYAADLNGDGKQDFIVSNSGGNNLVVYLGNGSGGFTLSGSYAVGTSPYYAIAADFNGDGILDLASANNAASANSVSVLLGNGNGTFQTPALTFAAGSRPCQLAVGDFNADGRMDLAVANQTGNTVSVFINNGTTSLFPATSTNYQVVTTLNNNSPYGLTTGDVDGDGILDIISIDYYVTTGVSVLKGKGDGTFNAFAPISSGPLSGSLSIVAGDFNGDGNTDLAVGNQANTRVYVFLSTRAAPPAPLVTAAGNTPVCTLGTLSLTGSVLIGSGSGGLTYSWTGPNSFNSAAQNPPAIVNPSTLAAGIYSLTVTDARGCSGTATKTIVVSSPPAATASATTPVCGYTYIGLTGGPSSQLSYLWSGPNGFTSAIQSPNVLSPTTASQGIYTLTVASAPGCTATATTTSVTVTSATASQSSTICAGQSITVGTATHSKTGTYIDDIKSSCTVEKTQLKVLFGSGGAPTFPASANQTLTAASHGESLVSADFSGDGKPDLAYVNAGGTTVSVFINGGTGTFGGASSLTTGGAPVVIAAADFNNDTKADLVSLNTAGNVSYFSSNGNGTFGAAVAVGTIAYATTAGIATGDFNGDGNQDIAVVSAGANTVTVYLGNGAGAFGAGSSFTTGTAPYFVISGDFNGDGRADLAVANGTANTVSVLLGNGDGTFQNKSDYTVGTAPWWMCVGDFNGDGAIDIATANRGSNNVSVVMNNGTGGFANGVSYTVTTINNNSPYGIATADVNGDGKLDILATDYNGGTTGVSLLLGNGNGTFPTTYSKLNSTGSNVFAVVADDFNGDGLPDYAAGIQPGAATASVYVFLNTTSATLVATAGGTSTCPGGNLALTGSPSGLASYSWSGPNGFTSSLQNPTITNAASAAAGIYTLTVSGGSGCSATATTPALAVTPLVATASAVTPACTGNSLALTGGPVSMQTYSWSGPNVFTSSVQSPSIAVVTTAAAGVYTLSVVSSTGCSATATTASVVVNSTTFTNQSFTICAGQSITVGSVTHNKTGTYIDAATGGNGCLSVTTTKLAVLYGAGGGLPTFQASPNQTLTAAGNAEGIISADFSGDGKPDLAIANQSSTTAFVYINNGSGTFGAAVTINLGTGPYEIAAADFNGDGKADLLTANNNGTVSYVQSTGVGTFAAPVTVASGLGSNSGSVSTGDFNGDGKQDFAVTNATANTVVVFLGNGTGGFSTGTPYTTGTLPWFVVSADFNGDGKADLAVANKTSGTVSIFIGNGDGTFQAKTDFTVGSTPWWLAVGDFNNDGKIDLVSANVGSSTVSVLINTGTSPYFSAGNTTSYTVSTTTNSPYGVTVADFNGDGKLDIAATEYSNSNGISILSGNGAGGFSTADHISSVSTGSLSIVADDFNGDGVPDLAVGNQAGTKIYTYFNTASPAFTATASATTPVCPGGTIVLTGGPSNIATYSWSGPNSFSSSLQNPTIPSATGAAAGIYTLTAVPGSGCTATATTASVVVNTLTATASATTPVCTAGSLILTGGPASMQSYLWSGPNGFTSTLQNPVINTPSTLAAGVYSLTVTAGTTCTASTSTGAVTVNKTPAVFNQAFTICSGQSITVGTGVGSITHNKSGTYNDKLTAKDGCDSVVVTNLKVIFGKGSPSFTTVSTIPTGSNPYVMATADFNNDGNPDIAVPNQGSNTVSILLGNTTGGFTAAANVTANVSGPVSVASADFGNGNADLVVANTNAGTISVYMGNGSGGFTPATTPTYSQGGSETRDIVCADFNNDGKIDLAVTDQTVSTVTIYLGNGSGGFTVASGSPFGSGGVSAPSGTFQVNTGDFNGDGNLDLGVVTGNMNLLEIFFGNGSGGFSTTATSAITVNSIPYGLLIADFNGDGKLDMATANNGSSNVSIFIGNGTGGFATPVNYTVSATPEFATLGDFNGDGNIDIAVACQNNFVSILPGNGDGTFGTMVNFPAGGNSSTVVSGDFNGDGKPDLAVANYNDGTVTIMLNAASLANASATTPVCSGGSANSTLTLTDSQSGLTSYSWSGPNGFSSSLQNPTISNPSTAAAGIYTVSVAESHGCSSSAITVPVVINQLPATVNQTLTQCGFYAVGTIVHTANGTYTDVIPSAKGCDSIVITHLTIKPVATSTQTVTGCVGTTVTVGNVTHSESGTFIDRISNAATNGCDSVVTTTLNLLFGNGGPPVFNALITSGVSSGAQFGAAGDFNGDGKPDLAIPDQYSNQVSVLINNGNGFNAHVDYPVGSTVPVSVVTGDFNHDGKIDMAVADYVGGTSPGFITVFLGNGGGTFATPGILYPAGLSPYILSVADLNGDGNLDIVSPSGDGSNTNCYVLLGNATGGFAAPITVATGGNNGYGSYTADFNGDGKPDIVIANANSGTISVLINTSTYASPFNVSFAAPVILPGANVRTLYCGDFNGDNKMDIACTDAAGTGEIIVYLGNGDGTFGAENLYATGSNTPLGLSGADFNGDGKLDLAAEDEGSHTLTVMFGNGGGSFTKSASYATGGSNNFDAIAADFNGDGHPDVATTDNGSSIVTLMLNNGNGTFANSTLTAGSGTQSIIKADFNNDGKNDIAVANYISNTVTVYLSNGNGTFGAAQTLNVSGNGTNAYSICAGDFNGDGNQDLALVHQLGSNTVQIYLGNGNGTFGSATLYPVGSQPLSVTTADFNGDGKLDLAVANFSSNTVSVLLGNGNGTFNAKMDYNVGTGPWWIINADFNGDGKPDLATGNQTGGNITVLLNSGTGTFPATGTNYTSGSQTFGICSGDFNGDGKIDIAAANSGTNTISVFLNNGSGTFPATGVTYVAGSNPQSVSTADFNGDGKLDLAVPVSGGTLAILTGVGNGTFNTAISLTAGSLPISSVPEDFNGDGKPDIALANQSSGNVMIFLNITQILATLPTAAASSPICPNGTLSLSATPSGLSGYSWSGPDFYSASGQTPTLVGPGTLGAGIYTVTVTDSRGCTGTATTPSVVMKPLPNILVTPASAVCLPATSASLTASGSVSGYTWSPTTNLTPSAGTSATETAQISQLTFYTVSGSGSNGCSNNTIVPVATVATGGIISPNFSIICSGGTKALTVTGAAGHDYQWQISTDNINWTNITGATNTVYTTASGDGTTNKFYRLMAQSNSCWNVASTTAEVDISNPVINVTATGITDNSLTLNWSPTGTGNYTISYSGPSSATLTSVTPDKTITGLTANGTYKITVTQTGVGCAASGTITGVTTLCAMPTGVTLTSPASSQILVSWTGVVGADYRVYYRPLFSYNTYFTKDVSNVSSVLLTKQGNNNLYASTTYEVYVSRLDCPTTGAVGQGTSPTNVTTQPNVSCATPLIDSVRSLCPVQIEVFIHDNTVNQYNVYIQRITPSILAVNSYGVSGTYFTINTPYSGDQYLIAIEAKCGGALSNLYVWPGNATIKPLCTSPNNLVLSNPTCHGFTASWNADQCLSNAASEYALYLRVAGTINYNSYGVPLPGNGIGPNKTINFVTSGRTYQVYVRSIYNCNGFVTYGPSSQVETITTLSGGCRDEDAQQPEQTKPAVQEYSPDNQEVFSLYPNPNNGEFVVDLSRYSMEEDAVRIEVINMIGQTIITHLTTISGGHMNEFINLPNGTAAGTYMVRLTAGKNVYTAKINVSK